MTDKCDQQTRGVHRLRNPWLNRGSVFTEQERDQYGLRGLLPPRVSTFEEQVSRLTGIIASNPEPLNKYLILEGIHASDEALFYELIAKNIDEYLPVIYTPTVGEACIKFSHIFRYARGLYVTAEDKGRVRELVKNVPNRQVDIIVVTDGSRILGLGDLGVNGMGIPIGKLALYTACAGINPQHTLPVTLDVGTNNEEFLNDPLYMGLRHKRIPDEALFELFKEFVAAVYERWPNVMIQFEDFQNVRAYELLARWENEIPCFNDDIQGTASVAVAGLFSSMRALKAKLSDQRILFLGAGSAATGIANLIADAMVEEDGISREEALKRLHLFDSKGLVTSTRGGNLQASKKPFAHDTDNTDNFLEAIKLLKPTAIFGLSAQPGAFNREIIEEMSRINERPMIFALSNPTSKAECTAEQAYTWSNGKCLFACGSPFDPVTVNGKTFVPRQGNNHYVFPGIGLGCIFVKTKLIPNEVFLVGAKKLASLVSEADLGNGSLYPPLCEVRPIAAEVGAAVAEYLFDKGLARIERPADIATEIKNFMWQPSNPKFGDQE
ncbi:MAG: NAD-dependent malic enzyme [Burkholderiaceae bacterium]|nr:NAD-dependent malic enzyme [Burkholderiaceae bacterium]